MSIKPLSIPTKYLRKSISSASMSFKVNNIKSWGVNSLGQNIDLAPSDFGTRAFCAFRNDTGTILEIMEIDPSTIASSSITILKRGLKFDGDLETEVSTYKLDWSDGSIVQFGTDLPQLINSYSQTSNGTIAPNTTPVKIGDIYVDTVTKKVYISVGTSSSADWIILN